MDKLTALERLVTAQSEMLEIHSNLITGQQQRIDLIIQALEANDTLSEASQNHLAALESHQAKTIDWIKTIDAKVDYIAEKLKVP